MPISDRAFDLLCSLARRPRELVSKQELLDIWLPSIVSEGNLYVHINAIRSCHVLVASVSRRGYRLLSDAVLHHEHPGGPVASITVTNASTGGSSTLSRMIGREEDLALLASQLHEHRLVTVTGPVGVGKTLLAQHAVKLFADARGHSVHWVDLALLEQTPALVAAITESLHLSREPIVSVEALVTAMVRLDGLLVLDNAERVHGAVSELVGRLLRVTGSLRVLVTSQAPLELQAEQVHRLQGLRWPDGNPDAMAAQCFGAVRFFVDRARAADSRFVLSDADVASVLRICRALDGIPLALQLAAALVRSRGVKGTADAMTDKLALRARSVDGIPERQRSLRAAMAWSHDLLQPQEQRLFRRLAVCRDGSSSDLVQSLGGEAGGAAFGEWATALDTLVAHSLVTCVACQEPPWEPRYRMLESARSYALELLAASGEETAIRTRHAAHLVAQFKAQWSGPISGSESMDAWRRAVSLDVDNAREAMRWATRTSRAELVLALGTTLLRVLPRSMHAERLQYASECQMTMSPEQPIGLRQEACVALSGAWLQSRPALSLAAAHQAVLLERERQASDRDSWRLYQALGAWVLAACEHRSEQDLQLSVESLAEMKRLEDGRWPSQRLLLGSEAEASLCGWRGNTAGQLRAARMAWDLVKSAGNAGDAQLERLMDAELSAGNLKHVLEQGEPFLDDGELADRTDYTATHVRSNVFRAQLAIGDLEGARRQAKLGWYQAQRYDMQLRWTACLALLLAKEGNYQSAALLLGRVEGDAQGSNLLLGSFEAEACRECHQRCAPQLGSELISLLARGAGLRDVEISRIAFGEHPPRKPFGFRQVRPGPPDT